MNETNTDLREIGTPPQYARVEPATMADLPELTALVMALFAEEEDFVPDEARQQHGLRLILQQPQHGRIFVVRTEHRIIGMVNILFNISTAEGGWVIQMEDVIILPQHRGCGYGEMLLAHVVNFARQKGFHRITLLTDKINERSQRFFAKHGFSLSKMLPMRWMARADAGTRC